MFTYQAVLQNDRIKWFGKKPKEIKGKVPYKIEFKIIEEEEEDKIPKNDLVEFFRNSPFYGVELDLERIKDYGRDIEL
jgi:hypothetical protein